MITIKFTGQAEMNAKLRAIAKNYPLKVKKALRKHLELLMTKMKQPDNIPIDTGNMRDTGFVESDEKGIGATMGFGGPAAPYTLKVHETHKTKSKFFERPFLEASGTIMRDVAEDCQLSTEDTK